jgi:hypothetical protein
VGNRLMPSLSGRPTHSPGEAVRGPNSSRAVVNDIAAREAIRWQKPEKTGDFTGDRSEEMVAEIERVVPESAGRIGFEGPRLPVPEALDSSRFGSVVGTVRVSPFGQKVAAASDSSKGPPWPL